MTEGKPTPAALARVEERLASIAALARELAPETEQAATILADCERALKRAKKRREELSGEWQRVELVPVSGEVVEFTGLLLSSNAFEARDGAVRMEIWQTQAGNLVAVDSFDDGEQGERLKVRAPTGEMQHQRMAVMEFFGWSNRARSMARKLGWSTRRDVE